MLLQYWPLIKKRWILLFQLLKSVFMLCQVCFFSQTLKFKASIGNLEVCVLVDGGSTHDFIQSQIVSMLKLPITNDK